VPQALSTLVSSAVVRIAIRRACALAARPFRRLRGQHLHQRSRARGRLDRSRDARCQGRRARCRTAFDLPRLLRPRDERLLRRRLCQAPRPARPSARSFRWAAPVIRATASPAGNAQAVRAAQGTSSACLAAEAERRRGVRNALRCLLQIREALCPGERSYGTKLQSIHDQNCWISVRTTLLSTTPGVSPNTTAIRSTDTLNCRHTSFRECGCPPPGTVDYCYAFGVTARTARGVDAQCWWRWCASGACGCACAPGGWRCA